MFNIMNKLSFNEIEGYVSNEQYSNLYEPSFMETYNAIFDFVSCSESIYEKLRDSPQSRPMYSAKVCNSIMGAGKSTAFQVIAKQAIQHDIPLLCVFNNKDNMNSFNKALKRHSNNTERSVLVIDSDSYTQDTASIIHHYQIVAITQQRLRDLRLGFGDFSDYKFYSPTNSLDILQRTVIIDEMPIFIDSVIFDIGKENNSLDWFDEMADKSKLPTIEIKKARASIPFMILNEMAEGFGLEEKENQTLATKGLLRHLTSDQQQNLLKVLRSFKGIQVEYSYKSRYKWFMELLTQDGAAIVCREEKKSILICARWLDYREYGNILVLDGTANITKIIYEHGGFDLIKLNNPHDYQKRLRIYHQIINTSKSNVRLQESQETIGKNIRDVREKLLERSQDILPLPAKQDVGSYLKNEAISRSQYKQFFKGRTFENQSMALNLLNTTGKNDMSEYSCIGLLSLPIRHPNYYRVFAIALYGTGVDVSLVDKKQRSNCTNDGIQWFANDNMQAVFRELLLADLSQIIHRTSLRQIYGESVVDIYIYTNRSGWIDQLKTLYNLSEKNIVRMHLSINDKFEKECHERLSGAVQHMEAIEKVSIRPGQFSRAFKDWLNRSWNIQEKKEIILSVASELGLMIDVNPSNGYKELIKS